MFYNWQVLLKPIGAQYFKTKGMIMVMLFKCIATILAALLMFEAGYLIAKASTRPESILMIYVPVVLTRAFGLARPIFHYVERVWSHDYVLRITAKIRKSLYLAMVQKKAFKSQDFSSLIGTLAHDSSALQNLFIRAILPFWSFLALVIIILLASCLGGVWVFLIVLAYLGGTILLTVGQFLTVKSKADQAIGEARQEAEAMTSTLIIGQSDLRSSNRIKAFIDGEELTYTKLQSLKQKRVKHLLQWNWLLESLGIIWLVALGIAVSYRVVAFDANYIVAFLLASFPLIESAVATMLSVLSASEYAKSAQSIECQMRHSQTQDELLYLTPLSDTLVQVKLNHDKANLDAVSFKQMAFGYGTQRMLYQNVNCSFACGSKTAIIGRSGNGKSTLLDIIAGELEPLAGEVRVLGINPCVINQTAKRKEIFGWLTETPHLFHTSVFHNLRIAKKDLTVTEAKAVVAQVGLKERLEQSEKGLDEVLSDGGFNLSGGEKQRLALARLLLVDSPIWLIDEPTAGQDEFTANAIMQTIMTVGKSHTMFVIMHRLEGIELFDNVLLLGDNGELQKMSVKEYLNAR